MQLGMIGLGRMGSGMARRLLHAGHACVVHDRQAPRMAALAAEGAVSAASLGDLVAQLSAPRALWLMLPATAVDGVINELSALLQPGDLLADAGNSHYRDDLRRSVDLQACGLHYLDVGTSGGVHGEARGYCLMVGGASADFERLVPVFASLAPGLGAAVRTPGRIGLERPADGSAEQGYLLCGAQGAGHFVKMVHNGIEYGVMAAWAEGLDMLRHADAGRYAQALGAETAPLRDPGFYQYPMDLPAITELWRRGSVISSWLLDLTADAVLADESLSRYSGRVGDSGEARWALQAAIDEGVPMPVLAAALNARLASRGQADYANRLLSAMRHGFGDHGEPH